MPRVEDVGERVDVLLPAAVGVALEVDVGVVQLLRCCGGPLYGIRGWRPPAKWMNGRRASVPLARGNVVANQNRTGSQATRSVDGAEHRDRDRLPIDVGGVCAGRGVRTNGAADSLALPNIFAGVRPSQGVSLAPRAATASKGEAMSDTRVKFVLDEPAIPTHWVNLMADIADPDNPPPPPLNPGTKEPAGPDDLSPIFPMALILQEVSAEPEIEIPEPVREAYKLWRPTPLYRARRLEQALDTPAHIYYKYEGGSPAGSHKPNTAVAQAYENAPPGSRSSRPRPAPASGARRSRFVPVVRARVRGVDGRSSYDQKPYRRSMIETWGATVHRSPSDVTEAGRSQAEHTTGSLGIAISEAVEVAAQNPDTNYSLGSVLNHVLLHQTVIGQEAIAQMEMAGEEPDTVIACVGGGSNFGGLAFPFLRRVIRGRQHQVHRGRAGRVSDADARRVRVRLRRHGRDDAADADVHARPRFVPPPVHAGGLRYHGDAPILCGLVKQGLVEPRAYRQNETFEAAVRFARAEGVIPAPNPRTRSARWSRKLRPRSRPARTG